MNDPARMAGNRQFDEGHRNRHSGRRGHGNVRPAPVVNLGRDGDRRRLAANARSLYTEELSHGQRFGALTVVNPFLAAPAM